MQRTEGTSLTEHELRQLMRTAVGHLQFPLYWLTAMTGMRRNEVLGLRWPDIDFKKKRLHLNRGLVAVGYEVHQTRGKTKTARRTITLDDTTLTILAGWRAFQAAEFAAVGITNHDRWVFTDGEGEPVHPHAVYEAFRRVVHNVGVPTIRFHDLRHTHGSLLIKDGIPVKVVSERLGHANIAFTMQTYQHVLPDMQADAATATERLAKPAPPPESGTGEGSAAGSFGIAGRMWHSYRTLHAEQSTDRCSHGSGDGGTDLSARASRWSLSRKAGGRGGASTGRRSDHCLNSFRHRWHVSSGTA
ncbi:MAG: site-specific integrase [Ilumatobacteraceae bacterium]